MKTFFSFLVLVTFLALLMIGCTDKSVQPSASSSVNKQTTLQKDNTGNGAWLYRYETEIAYMFSDEASKNVILIGFTDPKALCTGGDYEIFPVKDIYLPNTDPDLRRLIEQVKNKDVSIYVFHIDPWTQDWCEFLSTTGDTLCWGTGKFAYQDNDVYAWFQENPNVNSFGYKANATLYNKDGQKYMLNFVYKTVWDGVDVSTEKVTFKLQVNPVGK